MRIKLKLFDTNTAFQTVESEDEKGKPIHRMVAMVEPTKEYGLFQIPRGPNPRDIDDGQKLYKAIQKSYRNAPLFTLKNGGICVVADEGSMKTENGYLTFTCSDAEVTGHYDGQHTINAVQESVNEHGSSLNAVLIFLVSANAFDDICDARGAASCWNTRSAQKPTSERNIIGGFDSLKNQLHKCYVDNIMWRQNQKGDQDTKIKPECSARQVVSLLSTLLPTALIPGDKGSLHDVAGFARVGETLFNQVMDDHRVGPIFEATYPHANTILGLSDLIQESIRSRMGTSVDTYAIIKATSKSQLKKDTKERAFYNQTLFRTGETVEGALNKDLVLPIVYGLVSSCFDFNDDKQEFTTKYTFDELAKIWNTSSRRILKLIDNRFKEDFQTVYKSRAADFVSDTSIWSRIQREVMKTLGQGDWRTETLSEDIGKFINPGLQSTC